MEDAVVTAEEQIKGILAIHGGLTVDVAQLTANDDLYAVGLTSHASINVMLAIEEAFSIEFAQEAIRRETFASIASLGAAAEAAPAQA